MPLRVSKEAQRVRVAQSEIAIKLTELQEQHDLSDIEPLKPRTSGERDAYVAGAAQALKRRRGSRGRGGDQALEATLQGEP